MTIAGPSFGRWEKVIKTMLGPPVCKECGLLQVEVFDVGCLGTGNCRWPDEALVREIRLTREYNGVRL